MISKTNAPVDPIVRSSIFFSIAFSLRHERGKGLILDDMSVASRPSFYLLILSILLIVIGIVFFELRRTTTQSLDVWYVLIGIGTVLFVFAVLLLIHGAV